MLILPIKCVENPAPRSVLRSGFKIVALYFWLASGATSLMRAYHCLGYLYFYRMLHRLNAGAVSVRINLSKLRTKEKDLRGIVDPQKQSYKRTGCTIR